MNGVDRIQDFQDGSDRIVFEKLGVGRYASGGGNGTIFAQDAANGDVILHGKTSAGVAFAIEVADPTGTLIAAHISSSDFFFG